MMFLLQYFLRQSANVRTLILAVVGFFYIFIGSPIFMLLERENESEQQILLFSKEDELVTRYNISGDDYRNLTRIILALEPHKSGVQWSFVGALYFCITIVTTIGYGHSVPQTDGGKIASMIYAVIGVPLGLIMFQAMGERINTASQHGLKAIGRKMGFKIDKVSYACLVPFGLFSCCLIVLIGTLAFANFEQAWSYIDSIYYCVMTLTTIGFGDYVALQDSEALHMDPFYVVFSFVYIFVGLTVIGAFLNLVVLRIIVGVPNNSECSTDDDQNKNPSNDDTNFADAEAKSDFNVRPTQDQENSTFKECNSISCFFKIPCLQTTTMLCSSCMNNKNENKVSAWVISSAQENGFKSDKNLKLSSRQIQTCNKPPCDSTVNVCSYQADKSHAKSAAGNNVPQVTVSNVDEEDFGMHESREDNIFRQHHVHPSSNFLSPECMYEHKDWCSSRDSGYSGTQNSFCNLTPSIKNFDDVNEETRNSTEHFNSIEKLDDNSKTPQRFRSYSMDLGKSHLFREYPMQQKKICKKQELLSNDNVDWNTSETSHKNFENKLFVFATNCSTHDYNNDSEYVTKENTIQEFNYLENDQQNEKAHNKTKNNSKMQYCDGEKLSRTLEQATPLSQSEKPDIFSCLSLPQKSDCLSVSHHTNSGSKRNLFYNEELKANHTQSISKGSCQSPSRSQTIESSCTASSNLQKQNKNNAESHQPIDKRSQSSNSYNLTKDNECFLPPDATHSGKGKHYSCCHCSNSYSGHHVCNECVLNIFSRLREKPITICSCLVKCDFCGGIIKSNKGDTQASLQGIQTSKTLLDTHRSQSGTSLNTKSEFNKSLTPEKNRFFLW